MGNKKNLPGRVSIGQQLERIRKEQDLTLRGLAEQSGIMHPHYVKLSNGRTNYTIDTLLTFLDVMGYEITLTKKDGN